MRLHYDSNLVIISEITHSTLHTMRCRKLIILRAYHVHLHRTYFAYKSTRQISFIISSSAMNQVVSLCILGCAVIFVVSGDNIGIIKSQKHSNSSDIVSKCNETYHIKMGKQKLCIIPPR